MIEEKFTEKLIEKIKQEKITPKPKWSFFLKNEIIWITGILSVLFGAVSFSLIVYLFKAGQTLATGHFGGSFWQIFLTIVPIFWLVFLALFTFLAFLNIKKTKGAYKYSPILIFLFSVVASIILGEILNMFGLGQKFDDLLGRRIHPAFYKNFMNPQIDFWSNPEEGRLSGLIIEINNDDSLLIRDIDSKEWTIYFSNSFFNNNIKFKKGIPIQCFGQKISNTEFQVDEIMPAGPGREFFNNPGIRNKFIPNKQIKPDFIPGGLIK
ncbi:MAG TPA: hypothetical protein PLE28_01535 [bacterium]|nr:hypothetical protein [bacterium]